MSEVLNPELFEQEGLDETQFAEALSDLSVSNVVTPQGNRPEGYKDDEPQGGYQFF